MDLKQLLDVEIDDWIRLFPELFPCPTPSFLANYAKTKPLLAWTLRLQRQPRSCLDEPSMRLGSEELALQRLGSKGRAVRLLPLCSFHVQPICVYPGICPGICPGDALRYTVGRSPETEARR